MVVYSTWYPHTSSAEYRRDGLYWLLYWYVQVRRIIIYRVLVLVLPGTGTDAYELEQSNR